MPEVKAVDPILLSFAHRNGWSVNINALSPQIIERLVKEKASYLAILTDKDLDRGLFAAQRIYPKEVFALRIRPWRLYLFHLRPS